MYLWDFSCSIVPLSTTGKWGYFFQKSIRLAILPITCTKGNMGKAWLYNPRTPCLPLKEYYIKQTIIYNSCYYSSLNYNKRSSQWCTCNLKHVHWNKFNKLKPASLLLHQPHSQPASFLLATMWIAWTPSDGMCYHTHTLPSLPSVLHIPTVITHITPFRKGHLAILSMLAIFPPSIICKPV
jgi:hypothetical protein